MTVHKGAVCSTDSHQQSFSSLLSSIGGQPQAPQQSSSNAQKPNQSNQNEQRRHNVTNGATLTPSSTVVGTKRKSAEPESNPRSKITKTESDEASTRPAAPATSGRFQLSTKSGASQKSIGVPERPLTKPTVPANPQTPLPRPVPKQTSEPTKAAPPAVNGAIPQKRGFASIMEKAKAAQEAAKATGASSIKHKTAQKLTKRERRRLLEEAKEQEKAAKGGKIPQGHRSRSGTPVTGKPGLSKKKPEIAYKGTMKKAPEPPSFKGTMRAAGSDSTREKEKKKGQAQDKYGGYASWSDLDDAEDEEEEGYDSEGSSDMEGGFNAVEEEEMLALRSARKEDQEAFEEEERHKREKLERKRKLQELSRSAAAKKKY